VVGAQTPVSRRARVDLPAALGPMMARASPAVRLKAMPARIGFS